MSESGKRYRNGNYELYVGSVSWSPQWWTLRRRGTWKARLFGEGLHPRDTRDEAQAALDAWAKQHGLEEL